MCINGFREFLVVCGFYVLLLQTLTLKTDPSLDTDSEIDMRISLFSLDTQISLC